jgi:predicted AAA+ superfamily ATPase
LLGRLATQTGQIHKFSTLATDLALSETTVREYVMLLENSFLVHILRPWAKVRTKRTFSRPKAFIVDPGVAGRLLRVGVEDLTRPDSPRANLLGPLLETFVVAEALKEVSWTRGLSIGGYWRTYEGAEVDLVIEDRRGRVVAIEVKAARTTTPRDFSGLRQLKDHIGPDFVAGILLNTAPRGHSVEDRIHAVPIDRLWRTAR